MSAAHMIFELGMMISVASLIMWSNRIEKEKELLKERVDKLEEKDK